MRFAVVLVGIGSCLLLGACRLIPGSQAVASFADQTLNKERISQDELRDALLQFAGRFESTIIATANSISSETKDVAIQRRALRWKLGMTPAITDAAFLNEPEAAYVALLTLANSLDEYLTTGSGHEVFGEQQPLAVATSGELVAAAIEVGNRFLDEKQLARVTAEVHALVRDQPIRGEFVAEKVQSLVTASAMSPIFEWITAIPMSPFRALQGVDHGAQAIHEFNDTAMQMTRVVDSMPRMIRWNLQLLALDLSEQGNIEASAESFATLARSAESLSKTAEDLPGMLQALLAEAERSGKSLEPLTTSIERSATAVAAAGEAWGGLVSELSKPPKDPARPSRPFDIREWQATAEQIGTAATDLRALLDAAGALAGSEALAGPVAELSSRLDRLEDGSQALVDRVAWRILQLILVFFGLLFAYRLASHALDARRRGSRPTASGSGPADGAHG
ncbi:MAG: hypothetical protein IPK00_05715 [Deltaproteobacteria bacterium]|nr:hypothetical protein [Deltaproteobacteria bacterium]